MESNNKSINKSLMLAVKYLSYRPKTVYEMKAYIEKKGFNKKIIEKVITILLEQNYLNDEEFTKLYIDSMVRNKPKSKFALSFELNQKGVNQTIVESALEPYDNNSLALKAVTPKLKIWKLLDKKNRNKKLMNFLQYRGFDYDVCMRTLEAIEKTM